MSSDKNRHNRFLCNFGNAVISILEYPGRSIQRANDLTDCAIRQMYEMAGCYDYPIDKRVSTSERLSTAVLQKDIVNRPGIEKIAFN